MNISVIVRTRDEEKNIDQFCRSYSWATNILVADGGSMDETISKAEKYPNVSVRHFDKRIELKSGMWRNPQGEHIGFLIDWAKEVGSDWIVFSDCDEYPNSHLIEHQKTIFENTHQKYVRVVKIFLYHQDRWFPELSYPWKKLYMTLWAWKASEMVYAYSSPFGPGYSFMNISKSDNQYHDVLPPCCLLHDAWPDDETTDRKLCFYRDSGVIPGMLHPTKFGGELLPLESWMK